MCVKHCMKPDRCRQTPVQARSGPAGHREIPGGPRAIQNIILTHCCLSFFAILAKIYYPVLRTLGTNGLA